MIFKIYHSPVMASESVSLLKPESGNVFVDGTIGEGGHAVLLGKALKADGILIGIDKDGDNLKIAEQRLNKLKVNFKVFQDSYVNIGKVLNNVGLKKADGILLDLGFSMKHVKNASRGFSFFEDELLDMRYDTSSGISAQEWLKQAKVSEVREVLKRYGQEEESFRVAKAVVSMARNTTDITARVLADTISKVKRKKSRRRHPATKAFQAIRIQVNSEIDDLKKGLENALACLKKGGRLVVLTYHSLEDRIVKRFFLKYSGKCECPRALPVCVCGGKKIRPLVKILPKSGTMALKEEKRKNPASASAHIRVCEVMEE